MSADDAARNPFRNEADAFRIVAIVVGAALIVIALTLALGQTIGALAGVALLLVAAWRISSWLRYWLGSRDGS